MAEESNGSVKRTAELRWFVEAELPDALREWFAALGPVRREAPRTDVYLVTPAPDLNIKKREGRLEIKRRSADGVKVEVSAGPSGYLERWEKRVEPASRVGDYVREQGGGAPRWVMVGKSRLMQRYLTNGHVRPAPPASAPEEGCNVELTRLTVNDEVVDPSANVAVQVFDV